MRGGKFAQEIITGMEKSLKENAYLFKKASTKCCDCEKCGSDCPCEDCSKDCSCEKVAEAIERISNFLIKSSETLDDWGFERSAQQILDAYPVVLLEVLDKYAQTMDVSDKLYMELLELAKTNPEFKRDIRNLLLEVGEEGIDPEDLSIPTELAPLSEEEEVKIPPPTKLPEFDVELAELPEREEDLARQETATKPPSADAFTLEDIEVEPTMLPSDICPDCEGSGLTEKELAGGIVDVSPCEHCDGTGFAKQSTDLFDTFLKLAEDDEKEEEEDWEDEE